MKKNILMILGIFPALAFAQAGKYTVSGSLGTYNAPAKVYLQYRKSDKTVVDSATLQNGKFQFTGVAEGDPIHAALMFNAKGTGANYSDYQAIYLENGTVSVTGADSLHKAKVSGTRTNDDNARYNALLKPVYTEYEALDAKEKAATPEQKSSEEFTKANSKAEKAIDAKETAVNKKFIADNPDSYISLSALQSYTYGADYSDIEPLFNGLSANIKNSDEGKKYAERMPKLKAVALGAVAPEFAQADTAGNTVNLSSFRGKYVLVDFWASWCGPCRAENPNVVKAFNRYKNRNFTILGVSLDRPGAKDKWLKAIHKDGLAWTQVSDLNFWNNSAAVLYAVRGIPQNFLLDPDGKIIGKNLRGTDLDDKLEQLFGKI